MKTQRIQRLRAAVLAGLLLATGGAARAQLLHRYDFNSTSDSVGTANGTLVGSATLSGGALVTAGGNGSVNGTWSGTGPRMTLAPSAVSGLTGAFTIETWFKCTTGWPKFDSLFAFSDGTTANFLLGTPVNGSDPWPSGVNIQGGGGHTGTEHVYGIFLDNNSLHQAVLTYDGTTFAWYVDGVPANFSGLSATVTDPGFNLSSLTNIGINGGSPWPDPSLTGSTYDFRIYGQALSPAQVNLVYGLGSDASNGAIANMLAPPAFVWNGGGANDQWSTGLNWVGGTAPALSGNGVIFAGSARPTPSLDANYSVTGLTFSNNAASFTLGSANHSTLTLAGDLKNDSANTQTLNVPVSLGVPVVTLNAAAGSLVVNSNVSGTGSLIKAGAGTLTLGSGSTVSAGTVSFNDGTALLSGAVTSAGGKTYVGYQAGNAVVSMNGGTLNVGDELRVSGTDQGGSITGSGTFTMNGGTARVGALTLGRGSAAENAVSGTVTLNSGSTLVSTNDVIVHFAGSGQSKLALNGGTLVVGPTGSRWLMVGWSDTGAGELDLTNGNLMLENGSSLKLCRGGNTGANVVNQEGGAVTFYSDAGLTVGGGGNLDLSYAGGYNSSSTYNLDGGTLTVPQITASSSSGINTFNFNGGTLKAATSTTAFLQNLSFAYVRPGGANIDTAGQTVRIAQPLAEGGGGLTKLGAGTLTLSGGYYYSGTTLVQAGTLALDAAQPSSGSALTVNNATLTLLLNNGTASISADTLSFVGNTVLNLNYGTATAPTAPAIIANAVSQSGATVINVIDNDLVVGTYPLIYTGSAVSTAGFSLGTLPTGMVAHLANSGTSLDLVVTAAGQSLTWYGADSSGNLRTTWDINNALNWNGGSAKYLQYSGNSYGDNVTLDDTLFGDPAAANITLNTAVVPASVRFNNSATAYSITGAGGIDGATSVLLDNNGFVFLGTSNSYAGGTTVNGATLAVNSDSALGASSAPLTLNGGFLRFSNTTASVRPIAVTAPAVVEVAAGANAKLAGTLSGSGNLTKNGPGTLTLSNVLASGLLNFNNGTGVLSGAVSPAGSELWVSAGPGNQGALTVNPGASLTVSNWLVVGRDSANGTLNVNGGKVVHAGGGNITCGTLGTAPSGTINVSSGSLSNLVGDTFLGEGTANPCLGFYNQSGGTAYLGNFYLGRGDWGGSGIGQATISGGTLTAGNIEIGVGNNNTRIGTNVMTLSGGATVNATGFVRLAFAGSSSLLGMLTNNGGTLNVGSTALYLSYWPDGCSGHVALNAGAINLQNNASIIFAANGNQFSTNDFTQTGGAVTFYSDAGSTVGGSGALNLGNSGAAHNTYTLAGGTLTVPQIRRVSGTGTFVFNGGTLKAAASSTSFMTGLTAANVMAGGAVIDSAGNAITIGQALLDGDGQGGGLTKNGSGTLTLSGANTYTGPTRVNAGTLALEQPTLASASTVTIASGAVLKLDFSATNTVAGLVLNGVNQAPGVYNSTTAAPYLTGAGSLVVPGNAAELSFAVSGSTMTLSWPQGWILQTETNLLSGQWVDVPGSSSVTSTNITINPAIPAAFFRLRHP